MNHTLPQQPTNVNHWNSIHFRHGEDRAILGLSRDLCTNEAQRAGFDSMAARLRGFERACEEPDPYSSPEELCAWAADLQARFEAAQRRRAFALAIEETETETEAETEAVLVEMESPFYSGHVHEDLVEVVA